MSKKSWQMVKTPYERRFGEPLKGPIIPFGAMVENHLTSTQEQSRLQFGKKVLPWNIPRYVLLAVTNLEGSLVAVIEELENLAASEIHARRLNAREVLKSEKA